MESKSDKIFQWEKKEKKGKRGTESHEKSGGRSSPVTLVDTALGEDQRESLEGARSMRAKELNVSNVPQSGEGRGERLKG